MLGAQAGASSCAQSATLTPFVPTFLFLAARPLLNILLCWRLLPMDCEPRGQGFVSSIHCEAPGTYEQFQFTGNTQQTPPEERERFHCWGATRHRRTHRGQESATENTTAGSKSDPPSGTGPESRRPLCPEQLLRRGWAPQQLPLHDGATFPT